MVRNLIKKHEDELFETRQELEEERRRLMEQLGTPEVKKRLSSFREQITNQDVTS